ncbi:PREDICTED: uncharacterized protein LOC109307492 [Crocodylus porosus]|uniref:Uncharacterized LOC109307492 n=1 Tax=Crocodylus porosus TaxID=8502 RepID=A0A7M4EAY7_CROPO|nr:PREDICTED: uncharacterized protein LOC109307492 [Crocodylus porosus]
MNCITCHISFHDFEQAKKSVDSECSVSSRRLKYHRYPKNTSILVKSILEGYKPPPQENQRLISNLSERMRKRRTFADKELECIMLERELGQRELEDPAGMHSPQRPKEDCLPVTETNLVRTGHSQPCDTYFNHDFLNVCFPLIHSSATVLEYRHCHCQTQGFFPLNVITFASSQIKSSSVQKSALAGNAVKWAEMCKERACEWRELTQASVFSAEHSSFQRELRSEAEKTQARFEKVKEHFVSNRNQDSRLQGFIVQDVHSIGGKQNVNQPLNNKDGVAKETVRYLAKISRECSSETKIQKQSLSFSVESLLKG